MLDPIVLDFETEAIAPRPNYPPEPVGFAVMLPGEEPRYCSWGHPASNSCSREEGVQFLHRIWESGLPILCHHAKFDIAVATERLGLPRLPWDRIHDTQFLLFLDDPHAASLSLKPSAERLLGLPPEEQEAVRDWLIEHKVVPKNSKSWGAHIAKAPGDLVGRYAIGDVVRTRRIFDLLYPRIVEKGMLAAYDRERRLMPILLRNEQEGMRVDVEALSVDVPKYREAQGRADGLLRGILAAPDLNIDSDRELADVLEARGIVTEWDRTPTGLKKTSKDSLTPDRFSDANVAQLLAYRNKLGTFLSTFMEPWLEMGGATGRIHTSWNQVRGEDGGARTGRPSTDKPNFLNIPKRRAPVSPAEEQHGLPPIPNPRVYLLPDEGHVWLHRDYSAQEPRLVAHFEGGAYMEAFNANPRLDPHAFVAQEAGRVLGRELDRGKGKVLNLALSYGMGLGKMAQALGVDERTARIIKAAYWAAFPDVAEMDRDVKRMAKMGLPVRTWGGRLIHCEPPAFSKKHNKVMDFSYRVFNHLIQGSAADVTKEALIRYDGARREGRLLVSVYDEINCSAVSDAEMQVLRDCMESVEADVAMLTEGKCGPSWGNLASAP